MMANGEVLACRKKSLEKDEETRADVERDHKWRRINMSSPQSGVQVLGGTNKSPQEKVCTKDPKNSMPNIQIHLT